SRGMAAIWPARRGRANLFTIPHPECGSTVLEAWFRMKNMFQNKYTRENIAEILRMRGIMPTHQRIEIAHAIFSRGAHLSAEQILTLVNERGAETSKATVYNTLKLFVDRKLLREVIVDPSKVFYDPNPQPHHHFYNID